MASTWIKSTIDEIRRAVAREPMIERDDGYREWAWRFGAVFTDRTKRGNVICVSCGEKIPANTEALRVIHTEMYKGAGWTASKRFLHITECVAITRVTTQTITDTQIREILARAEEINDKRVIVLCKKALNDGATYLRAAVVREGRARCAALYNALYVKADKPKEVS